QYYHATETSTRAGLPSRTASMPRLSAGMISGGWSTAWPRPPKGLCQLGIVQPRCAVRPLSRQVAQVAQALIHVRVHRRGVGQGRSAYRWMLGREKVQVFFGALRLLRVQIRGFVRIQE